ARPSGLRGLAYPGARPPRGRPPFPTRRSSDLFQPDWRDQQHACAACDWQGTSRTMVMELHDDVTEYDCPACENPLLIVVHPDIRSEEHTSELQSRENLVCRLLLEKKKKNTRSA